MRAWYCLPSLRWTQEKGIRSTVRVGCNKRTPWDRRCSAWCFLLFLVRCTELEYVRSYFALRRSDDVSYMIPSDTNRVGFYCRSSLSSITLNQHISPLCLSWRLLLTPLCLGKPLVDPMYASSMFIHQLPGRFRFSRSSPVWCAFVC